MKKLNFLLVMMLFITATVIAQPKIYLNGVTGYTFDESFTVRTFQGRILGNAHYGGSIEIPLQGIRSAHGERTVEIGYQGMQTQMNGWSWPLNQQHPSSAQYAVSVNYLMAGFNNYFGHDHKIMGFGGINMGVGWLNNQTEPFRPSPTRFAVGIKGGGRFMFSEKVGLKLYAQLNSVIEGVGGGFYFGPGGGGAMITGWASVVQFGLGGGLTIGLGADKPAARR